MERGLPSQRSRETSEVRWCLQSPKDGFLCRVYHSVNITGLLVTRLDFCVESLTQGCMGQHYEGMGRTHLKHSKYQYQSGAEGIHNGMELGFGFLT